MRRPVTLVALLAGASTLFAVGRWTAPGTERSGTSPATPATAPLPDERGAAWAALQRLLSPAPPGAPAPHVASVARGEGADAKAVAVRHARARVEGLRGEMLSLCWPPEGLAREPEGARVTFSVTYAPDGRAIARGISVDRRTPAGALGRCLHRLPLESLSIPPPGTTVAVKLPMTFP